MTAISLPAARAPRIAPRLLVTLGALLVYRFGLEIPLAGLDMNVAADFATRQRMSIDYFSIFALGVMPILNARFFIEVVKLVFPQLARWESAAPAHARRLGRIATILALLSAAFQGWGMAGAFLNLSGLAPDADPVFVPLIVATLVAATAILIWLAALISRLGFGDGFWLLFSLPLLAKAPSIVATTAVLVRQGAIDVDHVAAAALLVAVATAALVAAAGRMRATTPRARLDAIVWPPLIGVFSSLLLLAPLRLMFGDAWFAPGGAGALALSCALILIVTLMRATPVEASAGRGPDPALVMAFVQIAICIGAAVATRTLRLPYPIEALSLIVVVATIHDVIASVAAALAQNRPDAAGLPIRRRTTDAA